MQYVNDEKTPEPQITPEEYLAEQKNKIRKRAFWSIGFGVFIISAHLVLFAVAEEMIPLGRLGNVQEVAEIVCFMLSDSARYITGQVVQADGGLAM